MRQSVFLRTQAIALVLASVALCSTGLAAPSYEELCQQGRKHLMSAEYKDALEAYSQAVRQDSARPLAYVGQALAYRATKQYDRAIEAAKHAIAADSDDAAALVIRGAAYHARKDLELAKADLEKAIQLAPKTASAYAELGRVHMEQGDDERAMFNFSKALELDPDDHATYVARGKLHRRQGHHGTAARDYAEAIRVRPDSAPYRFLRAQAHFDNRNYDPAIEDASKAIELNEDFAAAYVLKGAALYHQAEYEKALVELKKAAEMAKMDAGAILWLGKTRLELGEVDQSIKDLEEALHIDDKYVAAYRALAEAYEKAEKKPEEAIAFREKAQKLETELGKAAALGLDIRHDTWPSTIASTKDFDPTWIASETLSSQVPSADVVTSQVRAMAERLRRELQPFHRDVEVCEAATVVPKPCDLAAGGFQRSVRLFDAGDYEVAAVGFSKAREDYQAALATFDDVAGKDPELWMNWARQRAEPDGNRSLVCLIALADASYLCNDKGGYESAMQRTLSLIKASGMASPVSGVAGLLKVAEIQMRCDDHKSAKSTAASAGTYCMGIQDAGQKSTWMARCAGLLVRLGDRDAWSKYVPQAIDTAAQVGNRYDNGRKWHPPYVKCIAYAEAGALEQALAGAGELEVADRKPYGPDLAKWAAPAYATIAKAAARNGLSDASEKRVFESAYAAACAHLATLLEPSEITATFTRQVLAAADTELDENIRAWVWAANIPDPNARQGCVARMIHTEMRQSRPDRALAWVECIPVEAGPSNGPLWIAAAKVHSGRESFVSLKKWSEEPISASERAIRLAGIAAGISTKSKDDVERARPEPIQTPHDQAKRLGDLLAMVLQVGASSTHEIDVFDGSEATDSKWWLRQAVAAAQGIEDPSLRARVLLQLAKACHEIGSESGCDGFIDEALLCTTDVWKAVVERRGASEASHDGSFRWSFNNRVRTAEMADVNALMNVLFDIEDYQNEIGKKDDAWQTLLLALPCAVSLPGDGGYAAPTTPDSFCCWLARVSGRAHRYGRRDVAEAIMKGRPWSQVSAMRDSDVFLDGMSAAEAGNTQTLDGIAAELQRQAIRTNSSPRATYAARLFAQRALVAAEAGDEEAYRTAAMTVGGLVHNQRGPASEAVLAEVAAAAAIVAEDLAAREFLEQSRVRGLERDNVLSLLAVKAMQEGRETDARKALQDIDEPAPGVDAWYAVAKLQASKPAAELSAIYDEIDSLPDATKAAAFAGVAAGLAGK